MYRASEPFTFDDLTIEEGERPEAGFVTLFRPKASPQEAEPEEAEEALPPPTPEDLARKAFDDAYTEGEKAGYDMGMRRAELLARRLEKQIEEVTLFRKTLAEKYQRLAVKLAVIFAEAVILRECAERTDVLAGMIRKAMVVCEERGEIVIRVRREDLRYVEGIGADNVKVVADETLGEPGFIIETPVGDIDGRIATQIEELKNALIGYSDG